MDIAQFNKILGTKIKKANIFEGQNEFKAAIKLWVEISEMILGASKDRSLNVAYRSMLIKKTEQILAHIREIKSSLPEIEDYNIPMEILNEQSSIEQEMEIPKEPMMDQSKKQSKSGKTSATIIEDSEIANLPIGFKEIKPKKDFKIITPHDPSIVQKRLDDADKMDNFFKSTSKKTTTEPIEGDLAASSTSIKLERFNEEGDLICFACGSYNSKDAKNCKDCGSKLS